MFQIDTQPDSQQDVDAAGKCALNAFPKVGKMRRFEVPHQLSAEVADDHITGIATESAGRSLSADLRWCIRLEQQQPDTLPHHSVTPHVWTLRQTGIR